MKLVFFPTPEKLEILNQFVTYVVIDTEGRYHIAEFDGEDLVVTHGEDGEVEVEFLAALPDVGHATKAFDND